MKSTLTVACTLLKSAWQAVLLRSALTAMLTALLSPLHAADGAAKKPNILFILTDDEGLSDVGCYGSDRFKGKAPNIDALAATGVRFTHGCAPPLCCPSRTTLNTGRYLFRNGASGMSDSADVPATDKKKIAR